MKFLKYILPLSIIFIVISGASAIRVFTVPQGGTGIGNLPSTDEVLIGDGTGAYILTDINTFTGGVAWEKYTGLSVPANIITPTTTNASIFISGNATTTNTLSASTIEVNDDYIIDFTGNNLSVTDGVLNAVSGSSGTGSNWVFSADQTFITPSTTVGILINASSTIASNFRVDGSVTTTEEFVINTKNVGDYFDFFNGTILEAFNATTTSDGSTVTMHIGSSADSSNLTMRFSTGDFILTTPTSTILTTGSDTSPTQNFVYITQANQFLEVSTNGWPSEEHIKISYFLVPSATFVQTNGTYINQNWNDDSQGTNEQGHLSHLGEKIRRLPATYFSGVDANGTSSYLTPTASNVEFNSTSGIIYQMHKHTYPAVDTSVGNVVLVKNWSGDAYHDITNLFDIVADSTGTAIGNNKYFNLVFWGVANKTGQYEPMMINLPSGFYNTQSAAENDTSGFDDLSIPDQFKGESSTGFLVARLTIQMGSTWSVASTVDLRGLTPQSASGGTAGSNLVNFPDNTFTIFDETDVTKIGAFDIGTNITTANTRTVKWQDLNGTMALLETVDQTFTGGANFNSVTTTDTLYIGGNSTIIGTLAVTGAITGNITTATALANNGGNCAVGEIPLGVDTLGAVEGCYEPTEADITDLVHTATSDSDWTLHNSYPASCSVGDYVNAIGDTLTCVDATTEIDSAISTHSSINNAHQDLVTLAGTPNYLTLLGQAITLTKLDITDDTNLIAGTNITLATNTLNVDDAFLVNSADDDTLFGLSVGSATTTDTLYVGGGLLVNGSATITNSLNVTSLATEVGSFLAVNGLGNVIATSTPASGGASPLNTKGDLYTYDVADARLGVGADGTILKADSAQATGLVWATESATSPGGADTQIQYNNAGAFGGDANLIWDSAGNKMTIGGLGQFDFVHNATSHVNAVTLFDFNFDSASTYTAASGNALTGFKFDLRTDDNMTVGGFFRGTNNVGMSFILTDANIVAVNSFGALNNKGMAFEVADIRTITGTSKPFIWKSIGMNVDVYSGDSINIASASAKTVSGVEMYLRGDEQNAGAGAVTQNITGLEMRIAEVNTNAVQSGKYKGININLETGSLASTIDAYGIYITDVNSAYNSSYAIYNSVASLDSLIAGDSGKLLFGTGEDASIYYDGTDMNINPKEVGTGGLIIGGNATVTADFVVGSNGALGSKKACFKAMAGSGVFTYWYYGVAGGSAINTATDCGDTGTNATTTIQFGQ